MKKLFSFYRAFIALGSLCMASLVGCARATHAPARTEKAPSTESDLALAPSFESLYPRCKLLPGRVGRAKTCTNDVRAQLTRKYGRTLSEVIGHLSIGKDEPYALALFLAKQIFIEVDALKSENLGPLGPRNILVSFSGEVRLVDLDTRRQPGYMAPEQVLGQRIDRRADIFSVGALLYEMLTHQTVYKARSNAERLVEARGLKPPRPSTFNRKVPEELDRIILKLLTTDLGARYQNAIDVHDELYAFMSVTTVVASRPDLARWMKKTFRP